MGDLMEPTDTDRERFMRWRKSQIQEITSVGCNISTLQNIGELSKDPLNWIKPADVTPIKFYHFYAQIMARDRVPANMLQPN
jgi:hypothetical protein